ncbi:hypothetical protein CSC41_6034 [Pseudomonas aeruginosa]|nr:hypothetical protein CSC41_6034 [Pseudomonas aeruginosa]
MNRNRRNALIAGSLLLLAANLAALGGVAWNRSGEAESKLVLSQRELQRNWSYGFWSEENSGVELRLELRSPNGEPPNDLAPPLPPEQMRALGFSIPDALDEESVRRYRRQQEKQVLLVLELDGPAYRREVRLAEERLAEARARSKALPKDEMLSSQMEAARHQLKHEQGEASRLFIVDAGLDLAALRQRYPERQRYAIVKGRVRPWSAVDGGRTLVGGYISRTDLAAINVPRQWHAVFAKVDGQNYRLAPLELHLSFGQRLEPWITNAVRRCASNPTAAPWPIPLAPSRLAGASPRKSMRPRWSGFPPSCAAVPASARAARNYCRPTPTTDAPGPLPRQPARTQPPRRADADRRWTPARGRPGGARRHPRSACLQPGGTGRAAAPGWQAGALLHAA